MNTMTSGMAETKRAAALAALTNEHLTLGIAAESQPDLPVLSHWRALLDNDRIAWAILDKADASTNTLSEAVMMELDSLITVFESLNPKALVLRSAKASGFMVGAEISGFTSMTEANEVRTTINRALAVLDRLEAFPAPTIAVLHGFCLGGGLELALACQYRIARDDTKLGFPEVMLGLHPGLAGTWRSLRIAADPVQAMTLMLTGRTLNARRARRTNLVDTVVPERHVAAAVNWAASGKLSVQRGARLKAKIMSLRPVRRFIAKRMEAETAKRARKAHYPAPYALIDLWRRHGNSLPAMRKAETISFAQLITGRTAQNLIRVYFLREKLKQYTKNKHHSIEKIHVIGAGAMGGDIAAWCAYHGFRVTLQDREMRLVAPAIKRAAALFNRRISAVDQRQSAFDRLIADPHGTGVGKADLIIEAVSESEEIKAAVYRETEGRMRSDAILASNTSSILLERLRGTLNRPERFIGLHFFNPVAKMPLVEIVTHDGLDDDVKARMMSFTGAIDKLPLPVRSAPGFLVNRALTPYILEAFLACGEGIQPEVIDRAALEFGMPVGPIELADRVGLDIALSVAEQLRGALPGQIPDIPEWFTRMVADGKLGAKSGQGVYVWKNDQPVKAKAVAKPDSSLTDRLVLPLVNASVACLAQGLVEDETAADAGIIFGTGFAPFTGGPLHYARQRGFEDVIKSLDRLRSRHGDRFTPDEGWKALQANHHDEPA